MELKNLAFLSGQSEETGAVGAIAYSHPGERFHGSLIQDFELLVLIICESDEVASKVGHYKYGDLRYQIMYASRHELRSSVITGDNDNMMQCLIEGEIIWEVDGAISALRDELSTFSQELREQKLLHEFASFLRMYVESKRYIQEGHVVDAYYNVLEALGNWARIVLIEQGIYPDHAVWTHVQSLDRALWKLYQELTVSSETLEQRVELVLLACEFSVMSKMSESSGLLLRVLGSRKEPWSMDELVHHPQLRFVAKDLPLVLRKLVFRSLVKESPGWPSLIGGEGREIRYWIES
ncbi:MULTISPECIES: nucleotidyltransferase-like protein [unclassified Paenibacillus]|uniref:nucleotidyltransferase-like protein n=1 Tax=unclassified Paenibacillus TaxID=185978 RepID=UPI00203C0360|nr:nucleotidyltransferase-like protein [Paenibacillus sp. DCT19]MCM3175443.1 nucleotidyltransferase-like protein [Paenibacillus sp. MER 99-2]